MKNQKIIKICEEKFIYLNYSPRTKDQNLEELFVFLTRTISLRLSHQLTA